MPYTDGHVCLAFHILTTWLYAPTPGRRRRIMKEKGRRIPLRRDTIFRPTCRRGGGVRGLSIPLPSRAPKFLPPPRETCQRLKSILCAKPNISKNSPPPGTDHPKSSMPLSGLIFHHIFLLLLAGGYGGSVFFFFFFVFIVQKSRGDCSDLQKDFP